MTPTYLYILSGACNSNVKHEEGLRLYYTKLGFIMRDQIIIPIRNKE